MPKASRETAAEHETAEGYEGHFEHFEGGWTVGFERYTEDADLSPFFKGLPNDQCQCEHMGYVIEGKVTFRSADGEETFEAGDAYYVGPGHTPVLHAGTEVVEFSPTEELARTLAFVAKNMKEVQSDSS
jgi:mannose-6-phosphate isomerase-like protein (cupin superfamily)